MSAIRSKDTRPEMRLRRALFALGYRYRIHYRGALGRPDIVFPARKVAVFVDGDYWHGHSWKARGFRSLKDQFDHCRNSEFWLSKVKRNIARDRQVNRELRKTGWKVIRLWESQLTDSFEQCLEEITTKLGPPS